MTIHRSAPPHPSVSPWLARQVGWIVACCTLVASAPALAHDGPEVTRIAFHPETDELVMFSNRGLVFTTPPEDGMRLLCTAALGISNSELPDLAMTRDGRVILASSAGLRSTLDQGCSWQAVGPYGAVMSPALAQDPAAPDTLYVATYAPGQSGLQVSRDAGESWETLLALSDDEFIQEVRLGRSEPAVVYLAGQDIAQGKPRTHFIAHTTDGGQTWTRHEIELLAAEPDVQLLSVSPTDPETVLAKTSSREAQQRLLLSTDAGQSFRPVLSTEFLHDAAITGDGNTLWAASDMGLSHSVDGGDRFEDSASPLWMSCITEHAGGLWACGLLAPDFIGIGVSRDAGESFTKYARLQDLAGPVQCPEASPVNATCASRWEDWQSELVMLNQRANLRPATVAGRGGTEGAGAASAGTAAPAPKGDDGGCAVGSTGANSTAPLLLLMAFFLRRLGWARQPAARD